MRNRLLFAVVAVAALLIPSARQAGADVGGMRTGLPAGTAGPVIADGRFRTGRQLYTADPSGLPAQIVVEPRPAELPLELRAPDAVVPEAVLAEIGRGPLLRSPVRIEAVIKGKTVVAVPAKAAPLRDNGDRAVCEADLQAEGLRFNLRVVYTAGAFASVLKAAAEGEVERLEVVFDLAGPVDLAVAGNPLEAGAVAEVGSEEGLVWSRQGPVERAFAGSGDRGFTWISGSSEKLEAGKPSLALERSKEGQLTWRLALVNAPRKLAAGQSFEFYVGAHPFREKPAGHRAAGWLPWAGEALPGGASIGGTNDLSRADGATGREPVVLRGVLEGPAGGAARSAQATLADTFPLTQFRYLAAPHTGLGMQLRTNARELANPGASPACDRMALGRALLHDIGLDPAGLGQRVEAATVLRALESFGYFQEDGKTEFLPYWRSGSVVRYGEAFLKDDAFAVTVSNPMARVQVSVFLRPAAKDPAKNQALFVVVNEGDQPVREQFYVLQPRRCFGGPNLVSPASVIRGWDFTRIPKDSDWKQETMIGSARRGTPQPPLAHLRDLEDNGFVQSRTVGEAVEIYGLLYVPARSFRLVFGSGAP